MKDDYSDINDNKQQQVSFLDNQPVRRTIRFPENISNLVIKENYIAESQKEHMSKSILSSRLQENTNVPKLYQKLIGEERQKSYCYNIIVLTFFNINIAHFCFPYITNRCGLLLTILILLLCGLFSYLVQNALVTFVTHNRELTQCNYAVVIENQFGGFCASFLEFLTLIWYGMIILICVTTSNTIIYNPLVKHLTFFLLEAEVAKHNNISHILYYIIIVMSLVILNRIDSPKIIDFNVFFSFVVHIISFIVIIHLT